MYTANNSVCKMLYIQIISTLDGLQTQLLLLDEFVALEVRDSIFMFDIVYCLVYRIGVAEKGYIMVELSVHTSAGHSSMPPRESSIGILANAVAK